MMISCRSFLVEVQQASGHILVVLEGHNLTCVKRDRVLFEDISFSLNDAELLYVKGPNGAGKTSLLRILVGLSLPEQGDILFRGESIHRYPENMHERLVYFGHKPGLNQSLNAVENLWFWCQQNAIQTDRNELFELLAELGLVGLEEISVGSLSAGQQRRVALARLWLKDNAELWVLDEPFTALDVQGVSFLENKIVSFLQQGKAVIMTSHQRLNLSYTVKELTLEYQI